MKVFKNAAAAFVACAALSAPAWAQGVDDGGDPDRMSLSSKPLDSGSDADKTIAKAQAVTDAIQQILGDWSFSAIRGERRRALIMSLAGEDGFLMNEAFSQSRGGSKKWMYRAECSRDDAKQRVLAALDVENTFGKEQFMIVATPGQWYEGPRGAGRFELNDRSANGLGKSIAVNTSSYLKDVKFREAPAASNTERVERAAESLGTDPQTKQLQDFANAFNIPLVCSVSGTIVYEPYPAEDQGVTMGVLRVSYMKGRLYHRPTDTILAEFELKMSPSNVLDRNTARGQANFRAFPTMLVGSKEHLARKVEEYGQIVGETLGKGISKKLFEMFYANQPDAAGASSGGGGGAGPRKCPGCGDTILAAEPTNCPACDSPLPAAQGGAAAPAGAARRNPTPADRYELRFVNWSGNVADDVVGKLQDFDCGFGNWQEGGMQGNIKIYKCTFVGNLIIREINTALEELGKKNVASVQKSGNTITITRTGSN